VAQLSEHPGNANLGDTEVIAESLDEHGFLGAILVQRSTGHIIAGNHRYRTATAKGAQTLPGFLVDVDDDEAARILAMDNRSGRLGKDDEAKLLALLRPLAATDRGLAGTGYNDGHLEALLTRWEPQGGTEQPQGGGADHNADSRDPDHLADRRDNAQPLGQRGVRDVILAMPHADADELANLVAELRGHWGQELAQGEVLLRAARLAAEHYDLGGG
jgi:hypothetical protein